jgi:hypothetical protein
VAYEFLYFLPGPFFESYCERVRFVDRNEELVPYRYRLCSNHWRNDHEMRIAMFSSAPRQKPSIPKPTVRFSSKVQLETIFESKSVDVGVVDVEGVDVPLNSLIQRIPSLPELNGKELEGATAGVPAFLKRARSKIARSKSMSFLVR